MADAARAEETWTFFEGAWHPGNVRMMGPRTHAAWLASTVFDGARAFEGVTPDLDLHLARINRSAAAFGLEPVVAEGTWAELVRDGLGRFAPDAALYIRPMYWAEGGLGGAVRFDPASTNWCLCLYEAPMPPPTARPPIISPMVTGSLTPATHKVVPMASAMPSMPLRLPAWLVAGEDRPFSARMKKTPAAR